jgi:hypothetical protein
VGTFVRDPRLNWVDTVSSLFSSLFAFFFIFFFSF